MDQGLFAEGSAIRDISAEPFGMLGGGAALLLQLAHPSVARGVAEHSHFQDKPLKRLLTTLDYLTMAVYGTKDEAHRVAWSAMRAHDVVNGPGYDAHDHDLLLWVQSTLYEVARDLHTRVYGPLPPERAEEFYQQSKKLAELLGAPREALPADAAAFSAYWDEMVATLTVSDHGRRQARAVLHPRALGRGGAPVMAFLQFVTTGLLPEPIREQYGLPWSPARQAAFDRFLLAVTVMMRLTPGPVRRLPVRLGIPVARRYRWSRYRRPAKPARTGA